jgi:hypothetical protein
MSLHRDTFYSTCYITKYKPMGQKLYAFIYLYLYTDLYISVFLCRGNIDIIIMFAFSLSDSISLHFLKKENHS